MKKILLISLASLSAFSQTSNIFEPIDVFDLEYVSNLKYHPVEIRYYIKEILMI